MKLRHLMKSFTRQGFSIVFIKIMLNQMVLLFRKVSLYTFFGVSFFFCQATFLSVRILGSRWPH